MSFPEVFPPPAARMTEIRPFRVMEVVEQALRLEKSGKRVIHMEIGQPDFPAPEPVLAAAAQALRSDRLGYTTSLGIPELREAISNWYGVRFGVDIPASRIVVTSGASGAFLLALGVLVNPGDRVLLSDPGYPCYRNFIRLYGGIDVPLPAPASQNYQLRNATVKDAWGADTRGLVIASPSNPTGTMMSPHEMGALLDLARERHGFMIVDEIYQGLTYDSLPFSALALGSDLIVINSFSKYFCMTGWRLGWMVAPVDLIPQLEKLAQNLTVCPSAPAQHAALAAFGSEAIAELESRREDFRRRRDFLVPALEQLGFKIPQRPAGAFYVYADSTRFSDDSTSLCSRLLHQAGVAIAPGEDFGTFLARNHVRFAYTQSMEQLESGIEQLEAALKII